MPDENKGISLSDFAGGSKQPAGLGRPLPRFNSNQVKSVNVAEVAQPKKEMTMQDAVPGVIKSAIQKIPEAVARLERESAAIIEKGAEMRAEEALERDLDDEGEVEFPSSKPYEETKAAPMPKNIQRMTFDDDGLFDDDDDMDDDDDIDFPINNNSNSERTRNTMSNSNNPNQEKYNKNIDEILHSEKEPQDMKIEFPQPNEEEKEKLVEAAKETYNAVIGDPEKVIENPDTPEVQTEDLSAYDNLEVKDEVKTEDSFEINSNGRTITMSKITDEDLALLDDDDDIDDSNEDKTKLEEVKKELRQSVSDVFKPVKNKVNLNEFTIVKKPISASKVLNHIQNSTVNTATGVLFETKKVVEVSEYSSMEIQKMDPSRLNSSNYYTSVRDKYRTLYNHIIDPNKPSTFEAWLKVTSQDVIPDYFFTAYKATFGNANIVTYSCPECDNVFLKEVPVMDMIKYKDEETKKLYLDILHYGELNASKETYSVGLYQASDEYVFALKHPTLYEQVLEPTLLDNTFVDKYSDMITLISYIDAVYVIDPENKTLLPVDMKADRTNPTKTTKRKIKFCATVINSFTSDQLQALSTETDKYDRVDSERESYDPSVEYEEKIKYVYPACTCPKCGKPVSETEIRPDNMLFTRHQLGAYQRV